MSVTFRFDVLENVFKISLKSTSDLIQIYLVYSLLIKILKVISWLIDLLKKEGQSQISQDLNQIIQRSLSNVLLISSFYIVTSVFGATVSLHLLGHILAWTVFSEINQIFCGFFKNSEIISSFAYFGVTIEGIIIMGQLIRLFGIDFCDFI